MLLFIYTVIQALIFIGVCVASLFLYLFCHVFVKNIDEEPDVNLFWLNIPLFILLAFEWRAYGYGIALALHLGNFVLILIHVFGIKVVWMTLVLLTELESHWGKLDV